MQSLYVSCIRRIINVCAYRCQADDIKDFELQLCDSQPSCVGGVCSEFVLSGRLDNLCSSWQVHTFE